ncbi:unnamed protein product [Darwinula stevensoni]|uniref:Peroxidase n=1 Tax=Darwinula stevensoni TaxID=69355 RepID=A0A7R8X8F7_9CRUS|nr:unnamed protein product [Darwinula stevensoni]CAG0883375.1 unnamed protein product [Darwinula stevensoni]
MSYEERNRSEAIQGNTSTWSRRSHLGSRRAGVASGERGPLLGMRSSEYDPIHPPTTYQVCLQQYSKFRTSILVLAALALLTLLVLVTVLATKSPGKATDNPIQTLLLLPSQPLPGPDAGDEKPVPDVDEGSLANALDYGDRAKKDLETLEDTLASKGLVLDKDTAAGEHVTFLGTRNKSMEMAKQGYALLKATLKVASDLGLNNSGSKDLAWEKLPDLRPIAVCDDIFVPRCNASYLYRSINGSCNNLDFPDLGSSFTPYRRVLRPDYSDGVDGPRKSTTGDELPSPRQISMILHPNVDRPSKNISLLFVLWGQFLDHDITGAALTVGKNGSGITCCSPEVRNDSSLRHPACFPIQVLQDDTFYVQNNVSCLEFVRNAPAPSCRLGPRQQFNQQTAFIDGSMIYGASEEENRSIRSFEKGEMSTGNSSESGPLLPPSLSPDDGCNVPDEMAQNRYCFKAGDPRVNQMTHLTAMHTVWLRQHNRVAQQLSLVNPHWDDEKLFQETRRIIGAQLQHITYQEFLPLLFGKEAYDRMELRPLEQGYYEGYNTSVDPTIGNSFAAAAYRFGHSLIQGLVQMVGPKQRGQTVRFIQLHELYFNPFPLYEKEGVGSLFRGHSTMPSQESDRFYTDQVTNKLFQPRNSTHGLDLVTINIQRGRDHGIPSYIQFRQKCGLKTPKQFWEMYNIVEPEAMQIFQRLYRNVDDIDLYSGGILEVKGNGSLVGPTFACLLADQFIRLKQGDRFFYENGPQHNPYPFTQEQLTEIKKTTFSRILCDNADSLEEVPLESLMMGGAGFSCGDPRIPSPDWSRWQDPLRSSLDLLQLPTFNATDFLRS